MWIAESYAKINLGLHVLERLPTGYHAIETGFAFLDWSDRFEIKPAPQMQLDMDDEDIDLGLDELMSDGDVIETKLDLAKAYIEMGDTEGAKNLLDEVKAEGSEAQKSEADKLLDDL